MIAAMSQLEIEKTQFDLPRETCAELERIL